MKRKNDELAVFLFGWSRGGVIAVEIERLLENPGCLGVNECEGKNKFEEVGVQWIGLFDAVNQTNHKGWSNTTLPQNIYKVSHAIKSTTQWLFPTMKYKGGKVKNKIFYKEDGNRTTHADIGLGWKYFWRDKEYNSREPVEWMLFEAIDAGNFTW